MDHPSYADSLTEFTVDEIKKLLKLLRDFFPKNLSHKAPRKDDLISHLSSFFSPKEVLKEFYKNLSTLEQSTLQEIVHTDGGQFHFDQIMAKYGDAPRMRVSYSDKTTKRSHLAVLLSRSDTLPQDLLLRLKEMIPPPKKTKIDGLNTLPEKFSIQKRGATENLSLIIHETEAAALSDLTTLLNLCENNSIGVGETTGNVSATGALKIQAVLSKGDFYSQNDTAPDAYDVQIGTLGVRSFAWPQILQAGKMAKIEKNKLSLSRSGKQSLSAPKHDVIRTLWNAWLKNTDFHELSRIETFKGQKAKGRPLHSPTRAREMIAEALTQVTPGKWMLIDDFFRFIIALKLNFEIAKNPWALYINDSHYGSLGYNHIQWRHINGRFTLAFLLEYAATLGIIDVALTSPWGSVSDFSDFWGTDDLTCLSRYDGLKYIRLTKLGEWILIGQESYTEKLDPKVAQFQISPNFELTLLSKELLPTDKILIDRLCDQISDKVWILSKNKLLKLIELGASTKEIKDHIISLTSEKTLPNSIVHFLDDLENKGNPLVFKETCSLIECQDEITATLIAHNKDLKKFTFLLNDKRLVILKGHEEAFCKGVKKLGLTPPANLKGSKKIKG
ncbi:MAG: hypothetical protein V4489_06825 [Chlamydiota bacterium]